jgi:hypothetical protein
VRICFISEINFDFGCVGCCYELFVFYDIWWCRLSLPVLTGLMIAKGSSMAVIRLPSM